MEAPLFSTSGEAKGKIELPEALFSQAGSRRILQEVIVAYQNNQRRGTSNTKTRAEVSGGGHKPWRQKGTGNARSGSNRSPLWRKGGITFGPHPRSYRIDVNEYKKRVALTTALAEKAKNNDISVLEELSVTEGKTAPVGKLFNKTVPSGRLLVVVDAKGDLLKRAARNLKWVSIVDVRELNPWELMVARKILFTQAALKALESRPANSAPAVS